MHEGPRAPLGECRESMGIVWWTTDPTVPLPEPPELAPGTTCQWEMRVRGSFSDCFRNSMDLHHAGYLHASTFGNNMRDPEAVECEWEDANTMRASFAYISNDKYASLTGTTTSNEHVFQKPSTTWNRVRSSDGSRFVYIHLAMRPVAEDETHWYVSAASNYVPTWLPAPTQSRILESITRRVAAVEDRAQLEGMVPERARTGEVTFPLDDIYTEWLLGPPVEVAMPVQSVRDKAARTAAARANYLHELGEDEAAALERSFVTDRVESFNRRYAEDRRSVAWQAYITERTRAFDAAIGAARGVTHLVLLGAGADSRAYRLPCLRGVKVIEVDLPEVIEQKKRKVGLSRVRHVGHDLRDPLPPELLALSSTTLWVAEGVMYYLNETVQNRILSRCSRLVADFLDVAPADMAQLTEGVTADPAALLHGAGLDVTARRKLPGPYGTVVMEGERLGVVRVVKD